MEETIKVIQCLIDNTKQSIKENKELSIECINNREIGYKALETLLQAYKEDERIIEEMAKFISEQDIDEDICTKKIDPKSEENDCYVDSYNENVCCECVKDFFKNKVKEEE